MYLCTFCGKINDLILKKLLFTIVEDNTKQKYKRVCEIQKSAQ